jgi:hypothetical protein
LGTAPATPKSASWSLARWVKSGVVVVVVVPAKMVMSRYCDLSLMMMQRRQAAEMGLCEGSSTAQKGFDN